MRSATVLSRPETATEPGTIVKLPFGWSDDETWRDGYYEVSEANIDELRRAGEERRETRARLRETGQVRQE